MYNTVYLDERVALTRPGRLCQPGAGRAAHGHAMGTTHQPHQHGRDRERALHVRENVLIR